MYGILGWTISAHTMFRVVYSESYAGQRIT